MECGGKRSATPLWLTLRESLPDSKRPGENESAVAAALCRRSPKHHRRRSAPSSVLQPQVATPLNHPVDIFPVQRDASPPNNPQSAWPRPGNWDRPVNGGQQTITMLIIQVQVHVKPECIEAFREATVENARHSEQEPGVARCDVLQQADAPERFVLIEA